MNRMKLTLVMLTWGSIGLLTRFINLTPVTLAFYRSLIAIPVLFYFYLRYKGSMKMSLRDAMPYIISGIFMGIAWLCMFVAFDKMNISLAVLIYNMCPVYVLILSPFILGEKMDLIQVITIGVSFIGLYLVVGGSLKGDVSIGIIYALISGILYAAIVLINRKVKNNYNVMTTTFIQITSAAVILLPFGVIEGGLKDIFSSTPLEILLVIILGIVHTGIAYVLYFSTYKHLKAVEIVSFSYFEPLFSIGLGVLFLGEYMTITQIGGGILILGLTYYNEVRKSSLKYG